MASRRTPAPTMPPAMDRAYQPFVLDGTGWWLLLSDLHIPYHDVRTVEAAIATAQKRGAKGVILDGDTMDAHELSDFDKDPTAPRYTAELTATKLFLGYLRHRLPKARIVWKDGNHEERLGRYLMRRAPALFGLDAVSLPALLGLPDYGIEYVGDRRVIRLGRLSVVHGHEYRPGITTPVNPSRGLFLRAKSAAICGHFHQTSEHHEPTITGKPQGAWSMGCACQLAPMYMPLNKWNLGFAMVEVAKDGMFSVRNFRVMDGAVV